MGARICGRCLEWDEDDGCSAAAAFLAEKGYPTAFVKTNMETDASACKNFNEAPDRDSMEREAREAWKNRDSESVHKNWGGGD
jgi:hypothetical protein